MTDAELPLAEVPLARLPLAELQRAMRARLHSGEEATALAGLDARAAAGMRIYQNNYRTRLVDCLEVSFPLLRARIGEQAFLHAAVAHVDSHPPHAWTLDAYGGGFHATLDALFPDNPDLLELAWIEWALGLAFVAADAAPLPAAALAGIDWDRARLRVTPSLESTLVRTNAEAVWSALWQAHGRQDGPQSVPDAEMLAEPAALIVWRRGHASHLRQVEALELGALLRLRADGSFAGLCAMLVGRLGEEAGIARAGAWLAGWIAAELITDAQSHP